MILFFGELLADLITQEDFTSAEHFTLKVGGSPGNIARFASQLGVPTKIVSRVGNDPIGNRIVKKLEQAKVDISSVQIDNKYGTTLVFVQKTVESPDFFVIRGADRFLRLSEDEIDKILDGISIVHVSCWTLTHKDLYEMTMKVVRKAVERGISISFDPNCRDKLFECSKIERDRVFELLRYTTYLKPSLDDAMAILGTPSNESRESNEFTENVVKYYVEQFHKCGAKYVVLTAGRGGAFASVFDESKSVTHIPAVAERVVDATGAGDGFWAGMYYGLINKYDFIEACKIGAMVAGYIVQFVGADVDISALKGEIEKQIGKR
ncbi:sugar kinase [Fervidobacterium islandicum]|uniref:Sugar kinase n=1 Tax=Fervidobacterium islandicum TaxID=2423 RepID=A0AAI8CL45_FERIS|nr:sugar kinase [Fervidobacterium islandicum]AMW32335.1 sugar kinase [Fervidobacterium islandicum]